MKKKKELVCSVLEIRTKFGITEFGDWLKILPVEVKFLEEDFFTFPLELLKPGAYVVWTAEEGIWSADLDGDKQIRIFETKMKQLKHKQKI